MDLIKRNVETLFDFLTITTFGGHDCKLAFSMEDNAPYNHGQLEYHGNPLAYVTGLRENQFCMPPLKWRPSSKNLKKDMNRRTAMFRELIRKNKQLPIEDCIQILKYETRGVLSVLGDNDYPYGMPMNHWYNEKDGAIYFHCGNVGHRLDALKKHDKVSFCTYDQGYRNEGDWAWNVKSVIVFGRIEIIEDRDSIVDITTKLSHKFTSDDEYIKREIELHAHRTLLLRLTPEHICGKLVTES